MRSPCLAPEDSSSEEDSDCVAKPLHKLLMERVASVTSNGPYHLLHMHTSTNGAKQEFYTLLILLSYHFHRYITLV